MKESRGKSLNWETKEMKLQNHQFIPLEESVQFECFLDTVKRLKKQNVPVFIILGPYNPYILTPESRERLYSLIEDIKQYFDENQLPYFEAGSILPSKTYADGAGHMLSNGHDMLASEMMKDPGFREWLTDLK